MVEEKTIGQKAEEKEVECAEEEVVAAKKEPEKAVVSVAAPVAAAADSNSIPGFTLSLVWQKVEKVSLINPCRAGDDVAAAAAAAAVGTLKEVGASQGLLVFVSFAKDKSGGLVSKTDASKRLTSVASFFHKGKLFKHPTTNKACSLANSADGRRSLTLVPMSSLTCKLKNKNDVQYHDQLNQALSKELYDELVQVVSSGCPKNVDFDSGVFGCKQRLVIDSSEGPQMHQICL
jgi:hypothetical protein